MFRVEKENYKHFVYAGEDSARMDKLMALNHKFVDKKKKTTDEEGGSTEKSSEKKDETASEKKERHTLIITGLQLIALKASVDVYDHVIELETEMNINII